MIIYLHGASSSGKTSIAGHLQELLNGVWLRFGLDSIWAAMPQTVLRRLARGEDLSEVQCPGIGRSYVRCVEALAALGHNLIIDDDLPDDVVRDHVLPGLRPYPTVLVGVQCPLEELVRREADRHDRPVGNARRGFESVHRHLKYDLLLDSSKHAAEELAGQIARFVSRRLACRPILIVEGVHPNEQAAAVVATRVFESLRRLGAKVELLEVPYECTLLGNLDGVAAAVPDYCMLQASHTLDVNLEGLVGDEVLGRRFRGYTAFEFHNSSYTWEQFGIVPGRPISEYRIGSIAPAFSQPFEIGTWRNVPANGAPGKYVIEVPAVVVPAAPGQSAVRLDRLTQWKADGYTLDVNLVEEYLKKEVDIEATARMGFMDDCIVQKIANWVLLVTE